MYTSKFSAIHQMRNALVGLGLLFLAGCGGKPEIMNTTVQPESWQISGAVDSAQFTVSADVLHMTAAVQTVTAQVEGQNLAFHLTKSDNIALGERWTTTTRITLWSGISSGTYYINFTATDSNQTTVVVNHGAKVVITN